MVRSSCILVIRALLQLKVITEKRGRKCLAYIKKEATHKRIRTLIEMVLVPKPFHGSLDSQAAYLETAINRVGQIV